MVRAANELYGVREKGMSNPWVIGHEEYLRGLMYRVNEALGGMEECVNKLLDME